MKRILAGTAVLALAAGCASINMGELRAGANLAPTKGNSAKGTVTFVQKGEVVTVNVQLSGLKPNAEHAFHVHEKGDCSSDDGMSAGGHFNPRGHPHGPQGAQRHAGDLPNVKSDASGNASATFQVTGIDLGGGMDAVIGKGLIVHRDPDDYKSQPAGNAGPRIACAVIRAT